MLTHRRARMFLLILAAGLLALAAWPQEHRQSQLAGDASAASMPTERQVAQGFQAVQGDSTKAAATQSQAVPTDLNALLVPKQSEMRLVTQRYNADRSTLAGNYDGGGGGRRGARGAGPGSAPAPILSLSVNRIARLKRYDMDWQAALARLNTARLSDAARADLENLSGSIRSNLLQLDADTAAIARITPLVPFSQRIVDLSEARIRMDDMDAERAAGVIAEVTKMVGQVRARIEAGLGAAGKTDGTMRVSKDLALRGAGAVDGLRNSLAGWFSFYNGYDPLFTWWMGMPYKDVDAALQSYSEFLRTTVATADIQASDTPQPAPMTIAAAQAPRLSEVPDIGELLALPQDEMADIVQRFQGQGAGGRGGRGAGGGAEQRGSQYHDAWLAALKTLDFDRLSRNAQVDYLFIRSRCEIQIARSVAKPQTDIPRKTDNSGITGAARGRDGLILDLRNEMIPYTPEELIAIANREFAWCAEERRKASQQMGFGDDWKKALEKVKEMHVPPGRQPGIIRDLLFEAVDYLRAKDLLTVPQVAGESLHMIMMTPERQLVNPFFTGGSEISVSYPTNTMGYEARLQSMRGNSTPLSHATAFHEMIPGHNFVGYMSTRYAGYRARLGGTSFYGEGWPLYWELQMYDLGFHDTPEEKIGALFWRMHRCARIVFSLKFHMGEWSPQECVDYLVDSVGFERDNAMGEVRRSFQGSYGPLYQAAYLLGGLQLRALRRELVDSGQMTGKQFHDEIMRQGSMPIAMLRLAMSRQKLTRDMKVDWRFYGDNPGK